MLILYAIPRSIMINLICNNGSSLSINCMQHLKQIFMTKKFVCPISRILNINLTKSDSSINVIPKLKDYQSLIIPSSTNLKRIDSTTMDNITELADLVEVQESREQSTESLVDLSMDFSESESSSSLEEIDTSIPLEKVPYKEDHYQHSFNISKNHYKHIVGSKGTILQRLCSETKTVIRVSKKKKHVVIIGSIQKRIFHARHKIDKLIENSKNKLQFTHFISVPTNSDEIKSNFITFKEDVMQSCDTEATGFDERMFQKPEKLHLTISMLHLLDQKDEEKAVVALNTCKEKIIDPILKQNGPMNLELKGLKCMERDPSKAKILYISVHEESGLFQKMSDLIYDYFIEQGLSRRQHDKVTLHMTVINSLYLQRKKVKEAKKNFDARDLIKNHSDVCLGKVNLSTFHISMLTAKSSDGYFKCMAKIHL